MACKSTVHLSLETAWCLFLNASGLSLETNENNVKDLQLPLNQVLLGNVTAEDYLNIDTNTKTEDTINETCECSENHQKILQGTQLECNPKSYFDILKLIISFQEYSLINIIHNLMIYLVEHKYWL
jgi:hypothetical protein